MYFIIITENEIEHPFLFLSVFITSSLHKFQTNPPPYLSHPYPHLHLKKKSKPPLKKGKKKTPLKSLFHCISRLIKGAARNSEKRRDQKFVAASVGNHCNGRRAPSGRTPHTTEPSPRHHTHHTPYKPTAAVVWKRGLWTNISCFLSRVWECVWLFSCFKNLFPPHLFVFLFS